MQKYLSLEDGDAETLQGLCRSVLKAAFPAFITASIDACFYPYIGLTHTIRRKGSGWIVRISDHCRHAPKPVLEAILMILGCKVMRRKPPNEFLHTYERFIRDPWIVQSVQERRRRLGRKRISGDKGNHYSLREIYLDLNSRYYNNQIEIHKIGWGLRKSWNRLGQYDPVHHTITLSPVLDSPTVPKYVVRYIVYHEMLHAVFENTSFQGFRKYHPSEFSRAEREYPDFAKAKKFLKEFCSKRHKYH